MPELPPRQLAAVEVIRRLTDDLHYPPTIREIAQAMGVSHTTVRQYLDALERKGRITRGVATSRSVVIRDEVAVTT